MKAALSLVLGLLLLSCTAHRTETVLQPLSSTTSRPNEPLLQRCTAIYPNGRWQFVHTVDFTINGRRSGSLLGVTVVEENGQMSCALLTLEGLTLFAARLTDTTEIMRAVAPFDRTGFAEGLMKDVQTLFTRPQSAGRSTGRTADGREVCRLRGPDGRITDIIPTGRGCYDLRTSTKNGRLSRTVTARDCLTIDDQAIPKNLVLNVAGPEGYSLSMTLVSADHLSPDPLP